MAKKILVVDDEPGIIEIIEKRLKANNYEIIAAFNGEEALRKILNNNPDLIILDIMLPGMDGFKVLRQLRDRSETKYTPVIMLTAKGDTESMIKAQYLGSTDYIVKPLSLEKLSILIKKYI